MATTKKSRKLEFETDEIGQYQSMVLPVEDIETCIQLRFRMNPETVNSYALAIKNGHELPDLIVFCPEGASRYILADGLHRLEAYKSLRRRDVTCKVYVGDKEAAFDYAVTCNAKHGLQLSAADKRKIVLSVLADERHASKSLRDIGDFCMVSHEMVRLCKQELTEREKAIRDKAEKKKKADQVEPIENNTVRSQAAADVRTVRELIRGFTPIMNAYEPKSVPEHLELLVDDVEALRLLLAWLKGVSACYE